MSWIDRAPTFEIPTSSAVDHFSDNPTSCASSSPSPFSSPVVSRRCRSPSQHYSGPKSPPRPRLSNRLRQFLNRAPLPQFPIPILISTSPPRQRNTPGSLSPTPPLVPGAGSSFTTPTPKPAAPP